MRRRPRQSSGFTLIELILVLVIIAIIAAIVMPSVSAFSAGRSSQNTALQMVVLANYARAQAAAEGRIYRLNFDTTKGTYWLTAQNGGTFSPPLNEYNQTYQLPTGVQWDVELTAKVGTLLTVPADEQQVATQMSSSISQPSGQQNYLLQVQHQNGNYIEFDPSGRTDPATIKLTDVRRGGTVEVACLSATELFHILTPQEMTR
jgi:prepilin-type N-terminal cleavage/methylation domain-containing protein